MHIRDY